VSAESEAWLAQCGLTAEQMAAQMEDAYIPERRLHLYHCDHRGLPLALISPEGETAWCGEYDEWGNQLNEENPHHLYQPYRLPGQQHDEESGLYYNRNRYYDPLQGRYITQDPIGLEGGWNLYIYPLSPVMNIDPMGLSVMAPALSMQNLSALLKSKMESTISSCNGESSGYLLTCQTAYDSDCGEIHERCMMLCKTAQIDPDMSHIWGGSLFGCLNGCLPARCGGNAV
ncbi:RHS repeat-associated core domain-containing protein, partial [Escherichia coli]